MACVILKCEDLFLLNVLSDRTPNVPPIGAQLLGKLCNFELNFSKLSLSKKTATKTI